MPWMKAHCVAFCQVHDCGRLKADRGNSNNVIFPSYASEMPFTHPLQI